MNNTMQEQWKKIALIERYKLPIALLILWSTSICISYFQKETFFFFFVFFSIILVPLFLLTISISYSSQNSEYLEFNKKPNELRSVIIDNLKKEKIGFQSKRNKEGDIPFYLDGEDKIQLEKYNFKIWIGALKFKKSNEIFTQISIRYDKNADIKYIEKIKKVIENK